MTPDVLGKLAEAHSERDAVHIAIVPVVCPIASLAPGEEVDKNGDPEGKPLVGVVDPFLHHVSAGERFWLLLYPGTITSLRHEWTHPAFDGEDESWLKGFAEQCGVSYGILMEAATDNSEDNDKCLFVGSNTAFHDVDKNEWAEFWGRFEKVTGKKAGAEWGFFSCSC